jgi:hypothetical protein
LFVAGRHEGAMSVESIGKYAAALAAHSPTIDRAEAALGST